MVGLIWNQCLCPVLKPSSGWAAIQFFILPVRKLLSPWQLESQEKAVVPGRRETPAEPGTQNSVSHSGPTAFSRDPFLHPISWNILTELTVCSARWTLTCSFSKLMLFFGVLCKALWYKKPLKCSLTTESEVFNRSDLQPTLSFSMKLNRWNLDPAYLCVKWESFQLNTQSL